MTRARHGTFRETDEVEEVDVGRVVRRRAHVLERHEAARPLVTRDELAEIGVIHAREIAVPVEAVQLLVRELEVLRAGIEHHAPAHRRREPARVLVVLAGDYIEHSVEQVAHAEAREDEQERQRRKIQAVPLHLVDADLHDVAHEGDRDREADQLRYEPLARRERERHEQQHVPEVVEVEHVAELIEPRAPDHRALAGLHVERVRQPRVVVAEAQQVERDDDHEQRRGPQERVLRDAPESDRLDDQ